MASALVVQGPMRNEFKEKWIRWCKMQEERRGHPAVSVCRDQTWQVGIWSVYGIREVWPCACIFFLSTTCLSKSVSKRCGRDFGLLGNPEKIWPWGRDNRSIFNRPKRIHLISCLCCLRYTMFARTPAILSWRNIVACLNPRFSCVPARNSVSILLGLLPSCPRLIFPLHKRDTKTHISLRMLFSWWLAAKKRPWCRCCWSSHSSIVTKESSLVGNDLQKWQWKPFLELVTRS